MEEFEAKLFRSGVPSSVLLLPPETVETPKNISRRKFNKKIAKIGTGLLLMATASSTLRGVEYLNKPDIHRYTDKFSQTLIEKLSKPDLYAQKVIYGLHDSLDQSMDTLNIIYREKKYFAFHHTETEDANGKALFTTKISGSYDLVNWENIRDYKIRDSNPNIFSLPNNKILIMHEKSGNGVTWVEMEMYDSISDLINMEESWKFIPSGHNNSKHYFSRYFEGTPTLLDFKGNDINDSEMTVGFHYYDDNGFLFFDGKKVDRNARMYFKNGIFQHAEKAYDLNFPLESNDLKGNFGDRTLIEIGGRKFLIVEAQYERFNFDTWRLFLYDLDHKKYIHIPIETKYNGKSFGNPKVALLKLPDGNDGLVFTSYIFDGEKQGHGQFMAIYNLDKLVA